MFYMGITFDKKENKEYKTESGGKSAAKKAKMRLYDEEGNVVADYTATEENAAEGAQIAPDAPQESGNAEGENTDAEQEAEQTDADAPQDDGTAGEGATATMTNDVHDGALDEDPDGDVKIYDGGDVVGKMTAAEVEKMFAEIADGECVSIRGKIRRLFNGVLRVRRCPSWDKSAEAGVTNFTEKKVVGALIVDGKPMYRTSDGYYITGDPALVEYVVG